MLGTSIMAGVVWAPRERQMDPWSSVAGLGGQSVASERHHLKLSGEGDSGTCLTLTSGLQVHAYTIACASTYIHAYSAHMHSPKKIKVRR